MDYHVLLIEQSGITRVLTFDATVGQVSIIFSDTFKFLMSWKSAEPIIATGKKKIRGLRIEANSMAEVAEILAEEGLLAEDVAFVSDSNPLADQLLNSMSGLT
jgi:hypothetical protein